MEQPVVLRSTLFASIGRKAKAIEIYCRIANKRATVELFYQISLPFSGRQLLWREINTAA